MAIEFFPDQGLPTTRRKNLPETDMYLIIRLPGSRALKIIAQFILLALLIVSFLWFGSIFGGSSSLHPGIFDNENGYTTNLDHLPLLFHDLTNEGLFKVGEKAVFVSNGDDEAIYSAQIVMENQMDLVSLADTERQSSIPNNTINFAFASSLDAAAAEFVDRTLKVGGIVAVQLGDNPTFQKPSNYKIVYLRRFQTTMLAMKKTALPNSSPTQRRLCGYATEEKKAALKNLEDVLLEPPRAASGKSSRYLKKTKYLPDLMGDSLESYSRRLFIDVGLPEKDGGSDIGWFARNYPTRNKDFEIYKIETVTEEPSGKEVPQTGMSDWLNRNVNDDEYVVMKAEAEVVEEMMKSKAIRLVDELFLECKPQGGGGRKMGKNRSGRAYWECLALYGRLRDEGVAVHQWWG